MNQPEADEKSVVAHFAGDEFDTTEMVALLEHNGIKVAVEREWDTAFDGIMSKMKGYYARILVLESSLERAQELIAEFKAEGNKE